MNILGERIISVRFISSIRGFLMHLVHSNVQDITFSYKKNSYEAPSGIHRMVSRVVRSKIGDHLGIIQVVKPDKNADVYASFNRFVNTRNPYFIYLENPTALYHYSLNRKNTILGKARIDKLLNKNSLKSIICMSDSCKKGTEKLLNVENKNIQTIYPLVPENSNVTPEKLKNRINNQKLKLLFITQGKRFVSKGGNEVIDVMKKIQNNENVSLTIITERSFIPKNLLNEIKAVSNIELLEFGYDYTEMQKIYASHDVLLHLTSDDSFCLTILEAMKAGLPIISTDLYAIREMVKNGYNGFLHQPKWLFFNDVVPNPDVWNYRKQTIYNTEIVDFKIVDFVLDKINLFLDDRNLLVKMSLNSFQMATNAPFSREYIENKWVAEMKKIYGGKL
mgnify:CR=1 FL=1